MMQLSAIGDVNLKHLLKNVRPPVRVSSNGQLCARFSTLITWCKPRPNFRPIVQIDKV